MTLYNTMKNCRMLLVCSALFAANYAVASSHGDALETEAGSQNIALPLCQLPRKQEDFLINVSAALVRNDEQRLVTLFLNAVNSWDIIRDLEIIPPQLNRFEPSMTIESRVDGYLEGRGGHELSHMQGWKLNGQLVANDYPGALDREFIALLHGTTRWHSRTVDLQAAKELIESRASNGNLWALNKKASRMMWGISPYEKNFKAGWSLNEQLAKAGDPQAGKREWDHLLNGGDLKIPEASLGARTLNEQLAAAGNRSAQVRKVVGLARQKFGYGRDEEAAVQYMKGHHIHLFSLSNRILSPCVTTGSPS